MLFNIYWNFLSIKNQFNTKLIFSSNKLTLRGFLALAAVGFYRGCKIPLRWFIFYWFSPIIMTTFGALFLNEKLDGKDGVRL